MELTPMMLQYKTVKEQHPGEILFFRLGDFYEMFFDDAVLVSNELGLTLTSRSGDVDKTPMCGVPYHSAEVYLNKLLRRGYKIAIAEQIGDPKAPGLTKREVTKVITPGTVLSDAMLLEGQNNYVAAVAESVTELALSAADVTTGECFYAVFSGTDREQQLFDELYRLMMPELLLVGEVSFKEKLSSFISQRLGSCSVTELAHGETNTALLNEHFGEAGVLSSDCANLALSSLINYLMATMHSDLSHLNRLTVLERTAHLVMDSCTLKNLEITRNLKDGGKKNTLLSVLDFTKTAMGSRLLRRSLEYPLIDIDMLNARYDAVEELKDSFSLRASLFEAAQNIYDFERLLTRIEVGTANARDLVALKLSLFALPAFKSALSLAQSALLKNAQENISLFADTAKLLERAIVDDPGLSVRDGGIIKEGYSAELDEYRRISTDSKRLLQGIEEREREQTGIKTLKLGFNKVFGYYLEVRKSGADLVPAHYIRKQTLANAERFITEELKEFETKILGVKEKTENLEYNLFTEIRETVKAELTKVQNTARQIAAVDCLASLAEAASRYDYVRPELVSDGSLDIKDGRHPIVERILKDELFVPNDTKADHTEREILLITGPNMAGKSTYMRQTALLVLMAQVGSFVPARNAKLSPVDRIFTRIGASDDLSSGQSTFMVEMNEVAQILKNATKNSLILLDEVGRGTSTFDGISIARAVIEYIRDKLHAKTLFATHYHELTDMADERVKNLSVAVKERGQSVVFLRRITDGGADKSYGIHVARLAGLPKSVTARAEKILESLEAQHDLSANAASPPKKKEPEESSLSLFASSLSDDILALDVMSLTPIEAINELYRLQQQAKREAGKS